MYYGLCRGQRTTGKSQFPFSTTWTLEIELGLQVCCWHLYPLSHLTSPSVSSCLYKHMKPEVVVSHFHTDSPRFCPCFSSVRTSSSGQSTSAGHSIVTTPMAYLARFMIGIWVMPNVCIYKQYSTSYPVHSRKQRKTIRNSRRYSRQGGVLAQSHPEAK